MSFFKVTGHECFKNIDTVRIGLRLSVLLMVGLRFVLFMVSLRLSVLFMVGLRFVLFMVGLRFVHFHGWP